MGTFDLRALPLGFCLALVGLRVDDIAELTQEFAFHCRNLRKRTRLGAEEQANHHLQAIGLKEHIPKSHR